jgi:hypothetical protein
MAALLADLRVAARDGRKAAGGASPAFLGTLLAASRARRQGRAGPGWSSR